MSLVLVTAPGEKGGVESKNKSPSSLSDVDRKMLVYLVRNSWSTANTAFSGCAMNESVGNKALASLEKCGLVKKRHQGERFLWQASDKGKLLVAEVPVSSVIVPDASISKRPKQREDQRQERKSQNRDAVLKYFAKNELQTAEQAANATGLSKSIVNGVLYSLYEDGVLQKSTDVPPVWFAYQPVGPM